MSSKLSGCASCLVERDDNANVAAAPRLPSPRLHRSLLQSAPSVLCSETEKTDGQMNHCSARLRDGLVAIERASGAMIPATAACRVSSVEASLSGREGLRALVIARGSGGEAALVWLPRRLRVIAIKLPLKQRACSVLRCSWCALGAPEALTHSGGKSRESRSRRRLQRAAQSLESLLCSARLSRRAADESRAEQSKPAGLTRHEHEHVHDTQGSVAQLPMPLRAVGVASRVACLRAHIHIHIHIQHTRRSCSPRLHSCLSSLPSLYSTHSVPVLL